MSVHDENIFTSLTKTRASFQIPGVWYKEKSINVTNIFDSKN